MIGKARLLAALAVFGGVMIGFGDSIKADDLVARGDNRGTRINGADWATRSPALATNGMAATSQPLATQAALDVLKAGGTAVDAAIAANAVLGLVEPTGNGMGGDLFAIVWDPKTKKLYGLNASGHSPKGQTLDDLKAKVKAKGLDAIPGWGVLPVTVPGTVDGWFTLHGKFGKLPMKDNLAPAIHYAREGYPVTQLISYYMQRSQPMFEAKFKDGVLEEIDNYRKTYLIDGKAPAEGQIFKNPDLANTFEAIAEGGRDAFYNGPLTDTMVAYFKRLGGALTKEDFASQHADWVEPTSTNYRGYDVWELPPNGQGIAVLQMLNILEGYDLKAMGHNSVDYLHVMAEAKKLVYEDRARFYADPKFVDVPVEGLLSKAYAKKRRALIDMKKAAKEVDPGDPILGHGDTIYMTVADKDGMMVSLIQSNFRGMGSGLVADGLGFMFQDRGEQFALDASHPNAYAPGKRPFHTIIPAFMTKDGKPLLSFGLMGGDMQPQGHVQIVANIVDFGMNVQEAGDAARYYHTGSTEPDVLKRMTDGGELQLETGVPQAVADALRARGHAVSYSKGPYGGYQAILRDPETGVYWGASEMRKDGMAAGY
ncbi:gamma-glutamyltransferase [Gimibacter soli]|uniref:Glutathione hydrolase proenzyme n=2 Tax=Gimibacter soli TaxID=3024400 RepID=A0AAE9XQH1_9PROT|nr:gamma-glutamyltransferase [Gimibacter soli]WCL55418.1 gamma-glutamyltransferase [Gimibacter soli]